MSELCVSAGGARGIFDAEQSKRVRIPSYDAGLMPRRPRNLRSAGGGRLKKPLPASSLDGRIRRLRSQFACRNRSVRSRVFQGQSCSSCASGVEFYDVRAAYTLTKAPERVPDT